MAAPISAKLLRTSDVRALTAGETFKGIYAVNNIQKKTDKNGKPYWEMTVSDEHGILNAKIWSDAGWWDRSDAELENRPALLTDDRINRLKGQVVGITGKTADFRGQVQYNFNAISLLDQEKFPASKLTPRSGVPLSILESRLNDLIEGCSAEIRDFLRFAFDGPGGKYFKEVPAAVTNHHAYAHGLLEHSITVTEAARSLAVSYKQIYPSIDISIVIAGALLHDWGKIASYSMSPVPEVTLRGAVLDHIAIGYAEFTKLSEEAGLPLGVSTQIGHILLSHHGQKEFGSPVLPATLEALIVASADELDFRLFCWKDATSDLAVGQNISAYHYAAQRRFWRPGDSWENESS
ncbi:MAG: HD domain-containing protein [Synergistaceae bacterium]|jgi:3'-5' exoribonuclease|nr:HD domain-containing protein [Synergistaceae bacterium]